MIQRELALFLSTTHFVVDGNGRAATRQQVAHVRSNLPHVDFIVDCEGRALVSRNAMYAETVRIETIRVA